MNKIIKKKQTRSNENNLFIKNIEPIEYKYFINTFYSLVYLMLYDRVLHWDPTKTTPMIQLPTLCLVRNSPLCNDRLHVLIRSSQLIDYSFRL